MNIEDAVRLEEHIKQDAPAWHPCAKQIGNGEWVVKLANGEIVWSVENWNEYFVGRSVQQEEVQEEVMA